ncbi:uncharacterized protein I206_104140 [Kwoniella pini CBS 10737]|uniref:Zn(2)-C6 fungal-type domain-containing protein n=1 Tax=Kwoniella pini CBS 10737 TaxID=1296096 RepID=A0A1B9I2U3_9TREE|nr:uncharacterized protein I206_04285 [Kwoniella pini CBS 10737]OCF49761.1 hypothetical protein I206_04285 [Kwoniella pini CBS 10737]
MPPETKNRPLARGDACQQCKTRKVRCPAQKPACANCTRKNRECIYTSRTQQQNEIEPLPTIQPEIYDIPHLPTHSSTSFDLLRQNGQSSRSSTNDLPNTLPPTPSFESFSLDPSLSQIQNDTSIQGNNWIQDSGMVGLLPSMMGPIQMLPSPWENIDITNLLNDYNENGIHENGIDKGEISEKERDHLLLLYFTGQRLLGVDMHISSFYERLQSSDSSKRPHPCLLNAIYLMTCRKSPLESLRKLETTFYKRAKEQMEEAIISHDTVFDAIRAGTMLITWLFGWDRQLEGWAMLGQTVGLAIAVGLDRIESSVDVSTEYKLRSPTSYLPPAKSHLELADRINAFWILYLVNKCVCIGFELSSLFDLDRITTPLPRPWEEYETIDAHLKTCDRRITDIFEKSSSSQTCDKDHTPEFGYLICAADLMHQVSLRPQSIVEQEKLQNRLKMLNANLPSNLKTTDRTKDGKITIRPETATLQLITLCTEMFLYSLDQTLGKPDPRALEVARRILGILHLLNDYDIGDVNVFAIIIWCRVAAILTWESKRLESIGDAFTAASYMKDVQFVCNTLQQMSHIKLAAESYQAIQDLLEADVSVFTSSSGSSTTPSDQTIF